MGPSTALAGQQSDGGTTPYVENVNITGPAFVTGITWWGYYLAGEDPNIDNFLINGTALTSFPAIVRTDVGDLDDGNGGTVNLYQYFLNLSGVNAEYFPGGPVDLGILNDSLDLEWYWQGSSSDPFGPRAYLVEGDLVRQEIPEPSSIALFGLALLALGASRARKLR
nr:PEP-CTERM sorting domain-containing protein [uncultured Albidiferax sp.]